VESCRDAAGVFDVIKLIKSAGKKVGLTLKPETPIEDIYEFAPHLDRALVMSVRPGFGGQKFMPDSLERVRALRKIGPDLEIEIDGGINLDNVRDVIEAGVDVVVVGTGIFRAPDLYAATMDFMRIFEEY
jgi:ribulose-phosphate 3-epimerase